MADNLTTTTTVSTVPSGTQIATDDVAGVHFQKVKIDVGGDGASLVLGNANPLPVSDAGGSLTVDGTVAVSGTVTVGSHAVTNAGTFAVQESGAALTSLQLIDDVVATTGSAIPTKGAAVSGTDGTNARVLKTDTSGELQVDVLTLPNVTLAAGTNTNEVVGDVAQDAAVSGNPVLVGARASTATPTAMSADGDSVYLWADLNGALRVDPVGTTTQPVSLASVPSHAVTNAGTFVVQENGAALTALQLIDNIVQVEDAAAAGGESGVQVLGVRKDTGGTLASADGDFTPFQMDGSGNLRVNVAAGGAGDGAILDGASSAIKATVLDYVNSNPLAVRLSDTNGDYVGAGAGTQYTEDAVAAADPTGTAMILVRADTPASVVSADGDNVAARSNSAGAQYVELVSGTAKVGGDATNGLDVDVTRVSGTVTVAGTVTANAGSGTMAVSLAAGAAAIAKAEDAASADADVGVPAMAVRKATPANTSGLDGDYEMLQISAGRLWTSATVDAALPAGTNAIGKLAANDGVDIGDVTINNAAGASSVNIQDGGNSITVDNGGTFATQSTTATSSGNTTMQNAVSATGNGTSLTVTGYGTALCTITGTFTATVTFEGSTDAGTTWFSVSATQVGTSTIATTATTTGQYRLNVAGLDLLRARVTWTSGTSITVIGRATNAVNSNKIVALATGTNTIGALTANQSVNVAQINGVTTTMGNGASGTGVQRVTIASDSTGILAGVTTVTTLTGGGVAHDGVDSGNPVKVGAKASATLSDDTMVANADRTDLTSDLDGTLLVRGQFPLGDLVSERVTDTGGTSTAFTNFGAVASTRSYITAISVFNSSATAGYIDFRDGTAGSVLWTVALPAGGGAVIASPNPLFRTTANTALAYDVSAALTTVYISVSGFKSKV